MLLVDIAVAAGAVAAAVAVAAALGVAAGSARLTRLCHSA